MQAVAGTLAKSVRESDLVGRWGGEEFLALLPDVSGATLRPFAERCRVLVENSQARLGAKTLSVTVSIGATRLAGSASAESGIKRADRLMYRSKTKGRNRTTVG